MKAFTTTGMVFAAAAALCVSSAYAKPVSLTFPANVMPPPLSMKASQLYHDHPDAFAKLTAALTRLGGSTTPKSAHPPYSDFWTHMTAAPGRLCNPHLMHNGNVLAQLCNDKHWFKLVPDSTGSYVNGTWSGIANLPVINGTQYAPLYYASAVLPDGRLLIEGGEYNGGTTQVWTNMGAIYSQSTNKWTPIDPPAGVTQIGNAASASLSDGRFMLGTCCDDPAKDFMFNPRTLTWSATGAPPGSQNGQSYELLQSGRMLTLDIENAPGTHLYSSATRTWTAGTNLPAVLTDSCGTDSIGLTFVRANNTVVAFGADTCDSNPVSIVFRDNTTSKWTFGPQTISGDLVGAPAAQRMDGKVLFAISGAYGAPPTVFADMKNGYGQPDEIIGDVPKHPDAADEGAYTFHFLSLPTGEIMVTDPKAAYVFTPDGHEANDWAPIVSSCPSTDVTRGMSYTITGQQLNGRQAGAYQGSEGQSFTNFPLAQLHTSSAVIYANTSDFSNFSIAQNVSSSFKFTVPSRAPTGSAQLEVIANGVRGGSCFLNIH